MAESYSIQQAALFMKILVTVYRALDGNNAAIRRYGVRVSSV
jgi:hypothetical protein